MLIQMSWTLSSFPTMLDIHFNISLANLLMQINDGKPELVQQNITHNFLIRKNPIALPLHMKIEICVLLLLDRIIELLCLILSLS